MQINEQVRSKVEAYIKEVAARSGSMPKAQQQELLRQLESHIYEALAAKVGERDAQVADVEAVLSEMDPPESYGGQGRLSAWGLTSGKWALLVSIGGLAASALLALCCSGRIGLSTWVPLLLFWSAQLAAFILGLQSWREPFGKAAVFTSAGLTVLMLLLVT